MAALQSRGFALAGAAVLQVDLIGCGDSAGESGDATWAGWVDDVVAACALAADRFMARWPDREVPPLWLWGLRAGCLLAAQAAQRRAEVPRLIFWQPALAGKPLLQQFLRLDSVGAAMGRPRAPARESARPALAAGRAVSVAGYDLDPALASGLEQARLTPPPRPGQVLWFDVSAQPGADVFPAVRQSQAQWRQSEHVLHAVDVVGPPFWQTTEIEEAPALIEATLTAWKTTATLGSRPASERVA